MLMRLPAAAAALAAALSFFLPAFDANAQVLPLGAKVRDRVVLGDRAVPLLEGEWAVVASSGLDGGLIKSKLARLWLAQLQGNRLSRWIYVGTNLEWNSGGWSRDKEICDRKNVHAGYSDSWHSPRETECWVLNHYGMTMDDDAAQATIDFYRWSDNVGRPNTSLGLSYFFTKRGDVLNVRYYFNPVVSGFRDTEHAVWRGNPWHADVASKDPKKLEYLRGLKAIGEQQFAALRTVLK
jgi:hypothetical protein